MTVRAGALVFGLVASMVGVAVGSPASAQTVGLLVPLAPARIVDTRSALGADGPVGPDSSISVDVTGVGGVPDSGVGAVVLNVTAAEATSDTWLTVFAHGHSMPETSNLNVTAGFVTANMVVAMVGDGGLVDVYNFAGSVEVIADVMAWLPSGGGYTALAPQRVLDTRVGQPVGPNGSIDVQLAGRAGVPAAGVGAVVVGVTSTQATADTFLTVGPSDAARPNNSNLNAVAGRDASNAVVARLSADGRIRVFNSAGSTHVIVDVFGWLPIGVGFTRLNPTRILDTRSGVGLASPVGAASTLSLGVTGVGGVPATGVGAVVLNLTATQASEATFVTAWPSGLARPTASTLNPAPGGGSVANLVIARVGDDGNISLYNDVGSVHLIADVVGWFAGSPSSGTANQSPVAVDDAATTDEDNAVTVGVLANDSDADGDALVVSAVGAPDAGGSVVITGGGSAVSFDPGADFDDLAAGASRSSAFTYTVSDGTTADTATVTVTVTGVADDPTAVADAATVVEDSGANAIDVLANDTDIDGGPKTIVTVTQPANGTVVITGGGTGLTYQPDADTCGTDPFTYTLNGGSTGTVTVTVTCVNDGPTLATTATALAYDEDDGAVEVDPGLTVTDDGIISSATAQFTVGFGSSEDVLAFTNQLGITGIYDNATGTLTLSGAASAANYQTALRSVTYTNNSQSPTTATRTVSFQVTDDGAQASNIATRDITVASINDVPALTTAPGASPFTENGSAVVVDVTLAVTDADDTNIESALVEISIGFQAGDELIFIDTASITGTYNTGTGTLTLTGADTVANYQTALRSIMFSTPSDDPSAARTIRFTVNDGDNASNPATRGIAITAVNDAPVNNLPGAVAATPAGGTAWTADISGSISDPDSQGNDEQVTLQVVSGVLTLSGTTGLSFTVGDGTSDATMTFTGALAAINAAIVGIAYSVDPAPASDTLTITTNDQGNTGTGGALTDIDTVAITFNQSPVVTTNAVGTTAYTEGAAAAAVDPALTVTDVDDTNLAGATIEVSTGLQTGDVLQFTNQNGITGTYNAGTLTLAGASTVANYQTALRSITFATTNDDPTTTRTVSFVVTDGHTTSAAATRGITITPVNDPPTVTAAGATPTYAEGGAAVTIDNTITVTDPDDTQIESGQVRISASFQTGDALNFTNQNGISGSYNSATGVLSLTGSATKADYQTALRSITFSSTNIAPTLSKTIEFKVNDGDTDSNLAVQTVNITAVNDPPVVDTSAGTTANTENLLSVIDAAITVTDNDDTNLNSAVVQITTGLQAGDALQFTTQNGITGVYTPGTGALALTGVTTVANYQTALRSIQFQTANDNPTTSRTISFTVNDGDANSNTDTKTITITPVNDAPVITLSGSTPTYTENGPAVTVDGGLTVSDVDDTNLESGTVSITTGLVLGDTLTFTPAGGITDTNAAPDILALTGTTTVAQWQAVLQSVQYSSTSDNPTAATRTVSFVVNDGSVNSNTAPKNVTVVPVNDAPVLTQPDAGALAYTENAAPTVIAPNIGATDVDSTTLAGATITIGTGYVNGQDVLSLGTNPQNGITAAAFNATTGTLTLSGASSVANYQAALRDVRYANTSNDPTTAARTITFQVNDGAAVNNLSNIVSRNVTVTAVNDAPVAADFTFNGANAAIGNTALVINDPTDVAPNPTGVEKTIAGDLLAGGTDVDTPSNLLTLTATTVTNAAGSLVIEADGDLTYHPAAGFSGNAVFTYTLNDNDPDTPANQTDTGTITINVPATPRVWYVDNTAAAGGDGTSDGPFDALADVTGATGPDAVGDIIYLHSGTGAYIGGVTLLNTQTLHGAGTALVVSGTTLAAAGTDPTIANATGNGVTLASGNTLTGFTVGDTTGFDIANTNTATVGTLTISNVVLNGTGGLFRADSGGALTVTFDSATTTTAGASGIVIAGGATGSLSVTGATTINDATADGIAISNSAASATFTGLVTIVNDGGGANGDGVDLSTNTGTYSFNGGIAITVNGAGAFGVRAQSSGTVNIPNPGGTNQITSNNGTALLINPTTLNATLATVTSSGGAEGISLNGMSGSLTVGSVDIDGQTGDGIDITNSPGTVTINGGTIGATNDPAGIGVDINGGAANVTINATVTKTTAGDLIEISGRTGGTVDFNANLTSTNGGGIDLTANTGATISFDGGINASTGAAAAFNATGGGTIAVTDTNGATAPNNTLTTTTGTALNVANTNIGAADLIFQSISANGGANGIVLNNTGAAGGLTVTGNGGACNPGTPTCTGGTIQNTTGGDDSGPTPGGTGIVLNNTQQVSLSNMRVRQNTNYAIRGDDVTGFGFANGLIDGVNGTNVATPFNDGSINLDRVVGSVSITGSDISGGFQRNIKIDHPATDASATATITITGNTIHDTSASFGDDGVGIEAENNDNYTINVSNNTFARHGGDHINVSMINNAIVDVTINANTTSGGHPIGLGQGILVFGASWNGTGTYDVTNNTMNGNKQGGAIHMNKGSGTATMSGTISGNTIGTSGVPLSGSEQAFGIIIGSRGAGGSHTALISNNTIRQYFDRGIVVQQGEGNSTLNATVTGNTVDEFGDAVNSLHGIHFDLGILAGDAGAACLDIGGSTAALRNHVTNAANEAAGGVDIRLRRGSLVSLQLRGYTGGSEDDAAVNTYLLGRNDATTVSATSPGTGTTTNTPSGAACPQPT